MKIKGVFRRVAVAILLFPIKITQGILDAVGVGRFLQGDLFDVLIEKKTTVTTSAGPVVFHTPNHLTRWRAQTLLSKEPETIAWIDSFKAGSVFWDIGANVGSYSIYATRRHGDLQTIAFEPSIENTYLLNRNISTNRFQDRITAFPLALSDQDGMQLFQHRSLDLGGALNAFGVDYSFDGKQAAFEESYHVFGYSGDNAARLLALPSPNYIKLDVDGIEHLILKGLQGILSNPGMRSLLVELNLDFPEQRQQSLEICQQAGLVLREYRHADDFFSTGAHARTYNHVFERPQA